MGDGVRGIGGLVRDSKLGRTMIDGLLGDITYRDNGVSVIVSRLFQHDDALTSG